MIGPRSANFPNEYERNIAIKKGMRDLNAVPSPQFDVQNATFGLLVFNHSMAAAQEGIRPPVP